MRSPTYHQARAVTEDLPTLAAFVGFLTSVNSLVYNEVRVLIKGFSTFIAFIGFCPCVKSLVPNKAFTQTKGLATLTAFKRSFSSMNSLTVSELRVLIEGFPTVTTFVWFCPSVEALVSNKTLTPTERLATLITLGRLFPSVDSLTVGKVSVGTQGFPTLTTLVRFLPSMKDLTSNERLSTLVTLTRFLPRVGSETNNELTGLPGGLATLTTLKGPLSTADSAVAEGVRTPTEPFPSLVTSTALPAPWKAEMLCRPGGQTGASLHIHTLHICLLWDSDPCLLFPGTPFPIHSLLRARASPPAALQHLHRHRQRPVWGPPRGVPLTTSQMAFAGSSEFSIWFSPDAKRNEETTFTCFLSCCGNSVINSQMYL